MKLIKEVNIQNWAIDHTCSSCQSLLELDYSDIFYTSEQQIFPVKFTEHYKITCISCKTDQDISKNLPQFVKNNAKKLAKSEDKIEIK